MIVRREPEREEVEIKEPHDRAWFVAEVVSLSSGGDGDASWIMVLEQTWF